MPYPDKNSESAPDLISRGCPNNTCVPPISGAQIIVVYKVPTKNEIFQKKLGNSVFFFFKMVTEKKIKIVGSGSLKLFNF